MLFDTDVLIWIQRGNARAANLVNADHDRKISAQTYLEFFQAATNKQQHVLAKRFLQDFEFAILPLTENISHRAMVYIEEYALAHGLRAGDAIVAATATEHGLKLATSNRKHFSAVKDLQLQVFRP